METDKKYQQRLKKVNKGIHRKMLKQLEKDGLIKIIDKDRMLLTEKFAIERQKIAFLLATEPLKRR